jgi:hypothetical protein
MIDDAMNDLENSALNTPTKPPPAAHMIATAAATSREEVSSRPT